MMFLLRAAFWLGIVLVLLPSVVSSPQPHGGTTVSTTEAASAASATLSDLRQFCERQPAACAVGGQIAVALGQKAQAGAKMVYDFITEKLAADSDRPAGHGPPAISAPRTTLTPTDLGPDWRGPRQEAQGRNPA